MSFATSPDRGLLRALAHPVRLALLDALRQENELTATSAARLVGESPSNCSFHLRVLAEHGLVEEADRGRGRERPWRRARHGVELDSPDLSPETRAEAADLMQLIAERDHAQLQEWLRSSAGYSGALQNAAGHISVTTRLTPTELATLGLELKSLIRRLVDRRDESTQPDALPVRLIVHAFPLPTPSGGDASETPLDLSNSPR